MKETKVYVDELPEDCTDCPCYDFDIGGCQCKDPHFTYQSIDRFKGCSLIDIKTHDRELVKEVCEKIEDWCNKNFNWVGNGIGYDGQDYNEMIGSNNTINKLRGFLNQIQKEAENE